MDIRLPQLGEGADSGTVVAVFVKAGDRIAADQVILELENEKAIVPIPAPAAGTVTEVHVKPGDQIAVGQVLITLAEAGGAQRVPAPAPRAAPPKSKEGQPPLGPAAPGPVKPFGAEYDSPSGAPPPAAPSIRKLARETGIDLGRVRGSARGGRITGEDVRVYLARLQTASAQEAPGAAPRQAPTAIDFAAWGPVERKRRSPLRRTIGEHVAASWASIPHVTQFDEADITALMALRTKYAAAYEKRGARLTPTAFVVKAVVNVLNQYPQFNAGLDESTDEIVFKRYYHIGIAVETEAGLIVPVIRDADRKSLLELSRELQALAEKTRRRTVSREDLQGASFTVSNLGSVGGTFFTPIVSRGQVAILGVGRGALKPTFVKGRRSHQVAPRLMLPLSLSYDHRVVDGADGARCITALVSALESVKDADVKP